MENNSVYLLTLIALTRLFKRIHAACHFRMGSFAYLTSMCPYFRSNMRGTAPLSRGLKYARICWYSSVPGARLHASSSSRQNYDVKIDTTAQKCAYFSN